MAGAAVAGLLASAFVRIAIGKLSSAIAGQASLLWNFSKDLEEMKADLETISAVLVDAERQSVKEELVQVRLWLKRLKDAAIDISDMLEDYQDTSDRANMSGVLSCLPLSYKKIAMANRMKSLREKMSKIVKEVAIFNFKIGSSTNSEQHHDERETMSYLPEESVIGRDGEKQEIINLLSANTSNDDEIVIVAIYGLGGMGKSTLAQLVYNDAQSKKYDYCIWVYVSQDFNLNKIGNSIISQLRKQEGQQNMGTQQVIKQHIDELLHGKTVLVVLDDLWEEKMIELSKLKRMLHVNGSKVDVIVTTRKEDIAKEVSKNKSYKLQCLEDDKCWEIIKRFSKFELKSNHEKMEQVGFDIAKKCGGVALAARAVGFMLRSMDDLSAWTEINNSDIWNQSSEASDVLPSLKLSYERMPPHLRICFSYCAIFPKGHNIIEDDLLQHWIALDFIEQSKGKECINKLLGMSFLQVSKLPSTSQEHVVRYTMHDLVHHLATLTVADELKVFYVAPKRNTHANKYCRYSVLRNYDRTMKLANMPSKTRALLFSDCGELLDIQAGAFSFGKCLRILDFSECTGILLPASIGEPKQLRCLIAPRMQNKSLPECITELSKLQYLSLNGSTQISALPESIGKLGHLRYICLSGCSGISELPKSFGDLKSTVGLDMSGCSGIRELPESFGDLKSMVRLDMSGCSGIRQLPQSLGDLKSMVRLDMSGCSAIRELPDSLGKLTNLQHLELSRCSRLKAIPEPLCGLRQLQYLNMSRCEQIRVPEALMKLQNLLHLDLSMCTTIRWSWQFGHQDFSSALANLTNLKYLGLRSLIISGTKRSATYVPDWIGGMTNLEHLDLSWNTGLACLPASIGNLKRLHTLNLAHCWHLKSLPECIGTLGLKCLVLEGCSEKLMDQASSLVNYLQTLPLFKVHFDEVNGCSNLPLLEGAQVSELRIRCLENVSSLEEASKVKLLEKQNLSELSLTWTEDAVRHLDDNDLLGELVPPRGLKHMCLQGYNSAVFPGWLVGASRHLTNLVSIKLWDLATCTNLPPLGQLLHLEKLFLGNLPGIERIDREFCGGKGAFRRLVSFSIIYMKGLEEWNTTYSVEDGVEEFMFPVLDSLEIVNCPRLRLKPCPPTFRDCRISGNDQVLSSLEEVGQCSRPCSSSRAIKLDLEIDHDPCPSMRLLHHFPALRELRIHGPEMQRTSLPESMQHLTSLESFTLDSCHNLSALPEWLGDLSSLKSLVIEACNSIESLPSCIHHLAKLQKIEISANPKLKEWCESEENKAKLAHIDVQLD